VSAPTPVVTAYLPTAQDITSAGFTAEIQRGRTSALFTAIDPASGRLGFNNENRTYDPLYASSPFYGSVTPGRRVVVAAGGVTIFDGYAADWEFEYDVSGKSNAYIGPLEDGLARLGRIEFDEWTTTFGQPPGARIADVLARPEVNYTGTTALDAGVFTLQSDLVSWGSNVLNYCQQIAKTDDGLFFVDRQGVLTFLDRHHFVNTASVATFGTGAIGFSAIKTSYGSGQLYNRVLIDRVGYDYAAAVEQSASDATSISTYGGTFTLRHTGLLMEDDTQAADLAAYLLSVYKDPKYRIESVVVDVHGLSSGNQTTVLGLDLGSVVTVTFTPNGVGSAMSRTCIVEGIRHSISPLFHQMEFTLNDSTTQQTGGFYKPEDVTYGQINSSGVFVYPLAF
jgi:hypothetical protein